MGQLAISLLILKSSDKITPSKLGPSHYEVPLRDHSPGSPSCATCAGGILRHTADVNGLQLRSGC